MEMQINDGLLQDPGWDQDFNMSYSLGGDDILDYLVGSDISLAPLDSFETNERFSVHTSDSSPVACKSETSVLKSPWHESDSGVSDTLSFVGSPSDTSPGKVTGEDMLQFSTISRNGALNVLSVPRTPVNDDVMGYIFGDKSNELPSYINTTQTDSAKNATHTSTSGRPQRKCSKKTIWEPQSDFSDSDDSDSLDHHQGPLKAKTLQPVSSKSELSSCSRRNIVNIVKIVKPTSQANDATSEDILKALDEKSKKNAQQAKINREKKKLYIKNLEDDRDNLVKENSKLSSQIGHMTEEMQELQEEVCYLKSVLANASALSGLLKNISNVKDVKLSATFTSRKRGCENDHSYNISNGRPAKKACVVRKSFEKAGVCLHVSEGEACLEFCAHCSALARKTHDLS